MEMNVKGSVLETIVFNIINFWHYTQDLLVLLYVNINIPVTIHFSWNIIILLSMFFVFKLAEFIRTEVW